MEFSNEELQLMAMTQAIKAFWDQCMAHDEATRKGSMFVLTLGLRAGFAAKSKGYPLPKNEDELFALLTKLALDRESEEPGFLQNLMDEFGSI